MKYNFPHFAQKITNSIFVLSIRQAFIALLPYIILSAFISLALAFVQLYSGGEQNAIASWLAVAARLLEALFPLVIVIAVSYYLSQNIGISTLIGSILAVACFVSNSGYLSFNDGAFTITAKNATVYAILIPTLTSYFLLYIGRIQWLHITEGQFSSVFLIRHLNLVIPFFAGFLTFYLFVPLVSDAAAGLTSMLFSDDGNRSQEHVFFKWSLLVHGLWFLGIHGQNVTMSLIDLQVLQQPILPGITGINLIEKFATLGGAGGLIGFVLAVLWVRRDAQLQQIAKLSLPFTLFNVSEIAIYGAPIVLNPYFLLPFVICPLINFIISYGAISFGIIPVVDTSVPWITPMLLSGYLLGGGSFITAAFQLGLVILNTFVYLPFVRMYVKTNNKRDMFAELAQKLCVKPDIHRVQPVPQPGLSPDRMSSREELRQIIDEITNGELMLYYQPQIDASGYCRGIEALLRLKTKEGAVLKPYFLSYLEEAGFANAIDWWVIEKVLNDMKLWQQGNPGLSISINLHASSLGNDVLVNKLIKSFENYSGLVEIEISENAYITEFSAIFGNVEKLKRHGIRTAMDRFGTGFSSLSLLYKLNVQTVKLDRFILKNADTPQGEILYAELCHLCKKLGFRVIAEGVETSQQVDFVRQAGSELSRGWLHSMPLPLEQAMAFVQHTNFIARPQTGF